MFIKPGPHPDHPDDATKSRAVRIPHTHELLPHEGREVVENTFWHRRIAQGDVVVTEPPPPPAPPPAVIEDAKAEAPPAEPAAPETHG